MKKLISFIAIFILSAASAQAFFDVRSGEYYQEPVDWAVDRGIIDSGNFFRPGDLINRAEAAKILVEELGLPASHGAYVSFNDVSAADWFFPYVRDISANGLMSGYNTADGHATGYFGPADALTRAAAAKLVITAQGYPPRSCDITFTDVDYGAWYGNHVDTACAYDVMRGDATQGQTRRMRPADPVNRAEFITMLHNARELGVPEGYTLPPDDFVVTPEPGIAPEFDLDAVPGIQDDPEPETIPQPEPEALHNDDVIKVTQFFPRRTNNYIALQPSGTNCPNSLCAPYVAQFEIIPYIDSIHLKKLIFKNDDNTKNFSQQFGTFYLVYDGEVIGTGTLSDSTGSSDGTLAFNNLDTVLSKGDYHYLSIIAEVHDINIADQSGAFLKLYFDNSGSSITALSHSNGFEISPSSITSQAGVTDNRIQQHIFRKSVPLITYLNDNINQSIFTNINDREVYKFNIAAHANGDIEWQRISFDVDETLGISSSNYILYVENSANPLNTPVSVSGGKVTIDLNGPQHISKDSSVTYILKSDIAVSAPTSSQSISITLTAASDTTLSTGFISNFPSADFLWSDRSARSHSVASDDWTNGYEVDSFDINTVHLGYQGTG